MVYWNEAADNQDDVDKATSDTPLNNDVAVAIVLPSADNLLFSAKNSPFSTISLL